MDRYISVGSKRPSEKPIESINVPADEDDPEPCRPTSSTSQVQTPGPCQSQTKSKKLKTEGKARMNRFNPSWLQMPQFIGWLKKHEHKRDGHDLAYCKVCNCTISSHKSELERHGKSTKHLQLSKQIKENKELTSLVKNKYENQAVKRAEIKLASLVASQNLSFSVIDNLIPLCKDIFPDSQIAQNLCMKRFKATNVVKNSLGTTFLEILYNKLRQKGNFFSIVMDETTDRGSIKQCALSVTYIDETTGTAKTNFFDMFEVKTGCAEDLTEALLFSIRSKDIPIENLIGFSSDTTNVMAGAHKSVFSLLKKQIPHIVVVKCSCHMIHLAASKACMKLPRSVEDLLRNLGSHFSRSYGRQLALREFQEFFHVEIHKILNPAITRWLSLKQCVDRVLEQFEPLKSYLTTLVFEDPSSTTETMLATMKNDFVYIYLEFMSYVLGILCDFNTLFQSETPLLHKLRPQVEKMLLDLCSNFLQREYVKKTPVFNIEHSNPGHFLPIQDIYLGISAYESLNDLKKKPDVQPVEIETFFKTCQNFYIELVSQIKTRFDFSDPIFEVIQIVEPKKAQELNVKSLLPVFQRFPLLKSLVDPQQADSEWKNHSLLNFEAEGLDNTKPAVEYWCKVFKLKKADDSTPAFQNLMRIVNLLLILPFSNASVERLFSILNHMKTSDRNRLNTDTIVALMATREGIDDVGGVAKFEPSKEMINRNIWDLRN